jgi:hypothetical protein
MIMDKNFDTEIEDRTTALKDRIQQRLGQAGRSLKKIDLRKQIVDYPFAAVGIAAAAGAIIGLVRPKPQPGRITGALISTLGIVGFRLVREAAVRELGQYAKNYILNRDTGSASTNIGAQSVEGGGGVRYSPAH